jgi:HEAT repeat protein
MQDIWTALEERSRAWPALDRQALADGIWADYVAVRFARTGDPAALQFLYPYLNRSQSEGARYAAIEVAAGVFEGCGPAAVEKLDYFTRNTASYLKDRAVVVVGATVVGHDESVILDTLGPYLSSRNHFTRRLAVDALARAAAGSGSEKALAEIVRVAEGVCLDQHAFRVAVARVFSGRPTEAAYAHVVEPDVEHSWRGSDMAVGILLAGAPDEWYRRGCEEFFEPRLHRPPDPDHPFKRWSQFTHRSAVEGLCRAGRGKGMEPLGRMLHLRHNRCTAHALLGHAGACFAGADVTAAREPLLKLARTGDVDAQRLAAVCLGRLVDGAGDDGAVKALTELTRARHGAVRSAALEGLGRAARSSGDEQLRAICLELADKGETARAAVGALGRMWQGSGRFDVFDDLRAKARAYRNRPNPSRHRYRPLVECYRAAGLLYQGTGSMEPVDFLLEALAPSPVQWCPYRWAAGRALVLIEFSQRSLTRALGDGWQ